MTHQTINDKWKIFELAVLPRNASPVQRIEMKRAFFAGFHQCLCDLTGLSVSNEDNALESLARWQKEAEGFSVAILEGGA